MAERVKAVRRNRWVRFILIEMECRPWRESAIGDEANQEPFQLDTSFPAAVADSPERTIETACRR